jgi:hypothetical protein
MSKRAKVSKCDEEDSLDKFINESDSEDETESEMENAKLSIPKVKELVWNKYCPKDKDVGRCFCCNDKIVRSKMHVEFGHVIPNCIGGEYTLKNIRPVCIKCNRGKGGMHKMHMYEYIVRNEMYGMRHLEPQDQKLYVYDRRTKRKIVRRCTDTLDLLLKKKIVSSPKEKKLRKVIIKNTDPRDLKFQKTVDKILAMKKQL